MSDWSDDGSWGGGSDADGGSWGAGGSDDDVWGGGGGSDGDDIDDDDPLTLYENHYYEANDALEDGKLEYALELFTKVLQIEEEHTSSVENSDEPYGFFSLKNIIESNFRSGKKDGIFDDFKKFLTYITSRRVTTTQFEDALYPLLETLSSFSRVSELYDITLVALKEAKQENPRLRILLRRAQQQYAEKNWDLLRASLRELRDACFLEGKLDTQKKTQLVEVIALEIQMLDEFGEEDPLKSLTQQAAKIDTITRPEVQAIINVAEGKVCMRERDWTSAFGCFSRAVFDFDQVGKQDAAERALKYRLLAYLLKDEKAIDPFAEAHAKYYQDKPAIASMSRALDAYNAYDIHKFDAVLSEHAFVADPFMKDFHDALVETIQRRVIEKIKVVYSRVRLPFIANELNISIKEVERILVVSILDQPELGTLDQVNAILVVNRGQSELIRKYQSLQNWASATNAVSTDIFEHRNLSQIGTNVSQQIPQHDAPQLYKLEEFY
mmetsp:Transcript_10137/g.15274  ORF Transcript_10137/g.15274 Transcript_10137/m.15274 type:complete len:496 (+) Transcript_10137:14-1501(+)|eukprot:CAMPEP_0201547932 /NCGR_PEP_ID=MMETSP0173_2-20130828/4419_1 /ASSEMBLY_ACC=CAM_ASM_000268 /TAXON_ID=218659 /ORGANISM="Vexillifera sp., Strain DIVA3 564/2" /LENGTH=495 /DNA_ID=CAMNT_0047957127 /DNA_START=10 /DNA_END=1497 /DNA_ORIENTATION=-